MYASDIRTETEATLFDLWRRRGNQRAHAELVNRHLPLVRQLARRYAYTSEPLDDLVQVGSVGLLNAIARYDARVGSSFKAYAVPTILGELRRHFRDHTWLVRPPRPLQDLALAVYAAQGRLARSSPQSDTAADIARTLNRSEEDVGEALAAIAGRYPTANVVADVDGEGPPVQRDLGDVDAGYTRVEHSLLLGGFLSVLDDRAREVVRLTYDEDLLQREIAERIGCSQMHVARILRDALNRMRLAAAAAPQAA